MQKGHGLWSLDSGRVKGHYIETLALNVAAQLSIGQELVESRLAIRISGSLTGKKPNFWETTGSKMRFSIGTLLRALCLLNVHFFGLKFIKLLVLD